MSDDYATRIAMMTAAQAADPAVIAASVKEHERQQKDRADWHRQRGQRVITIRSETATKNLAELEERVADLRLEHKAIREGLAAGTLTAAEAAQRWDSARSTRLALPEEIDQAVMTLSLRRTLTQSKRAAGCWSGSRHSPLGLAPLFRRSRSPTMATATAPDIAVLWDCPKKRHHSRSGAVRQAGRLWARGIRPLGGWKVYRCDFCGYWHVGNKLRRSNRSRR
jgi:hypothetical protein